MKIPIILVFENQREWTKVCIRFIRKNTPRDLYQLIVIDNGSVSHISKEIQKKTEEEPDDVFMSFDVPVTMGYVYNFAIEKYIGDSKYFVTLHNDTLVTEGWLEEMLRCARNLEERGEVFSGVSPRTNYAYIGSPVMHDEEVRDVFIKYKTNNKINCSEEEILNVISETYSEYGGLEKFSKTIMDNNLEKFSISGELNGFCTLLPTEIVKEIGSFEDCFVQAGPEFKIYDHLTKKKAYFPSLSLGTYVHHNGNTTNDGFGRNFRENFEDCDFTVREKIKEIEEKEKDKIKFNIKFLKEKTNLILIRDKGFGDIIMSLFAVQGLKDKIPNMDVVCAIDPEFLGLIRGFVCVDSVIPFDSKGMSYTKSNIRDIDLDYIEKFDIVLNLIKRFEMFNRESREHRIIQSFNYLKEVLKEKGICVDFKPTVPKYELTSRQIEYKNNLPASDLPRIGILPQGSCAIRSLKRDVFQKIIEIESKNKQVIILGQENIHINLENIDEKNILNLSGEKAKVDDLVPIIGSCEYIYTTDSGGFHIAGILGVPCRAFFGTFDPSERDGYYSSSDQNTIYYKKELDCVPCNDVGCSLIPCMDYADEDIEKIVSGMPLK